MVVPVRAPEPGPPSSPAAGEPSPTLVTPPSARERVDVAVAGWRARLVDAAGESALADVSLLGDAALDLSAAHPSGLAQLLAGRPTRLSNLVREGAALATARRRARAVAARASADEQRYGVAATYLAIGTAVWSAPRPPDPSTDDVAALAAATTGQAATAATSAATPGGRAHPATAGQTGSTTSGAPTSADVGGGGRTAGRAEADDAEAGGPTPQVVRAPVLLRPITLRARGGVDGEVELLLEPSVEVNPVVARALRSRGALLDPAALARGAFTGGGFDPRPALDRLAGLGAAVLDGFELVDRLVVGTFVQPGQLLVDDLDALAGSLASNELVAALAGDDDAVAALHPALPAPVRGDRDPDAERGVGDLDPVQQHVLDVVATGAHLFVDAPPGADVAGTVAAIVADAAAGGRTVLYVPGHRHAADALAARLAECGVGDILLDVAPEPGWRTAAARRLLGAMTLEPGAVDAERIRSVRAELVARREQLRGYVDALHAVHEPWGVSAYDALQALAALTAPRPAPRTRVRLAAGAVAALDAGRRAELGADLARAAELGMFSRRPQDSPWYGADVATVDDAQACVAAVERLLDVGLPAVAGRIEAVAADTGLLPAPDIATWAEQLGVLAGVRTALDVFRPMIFERTAADLVAATATPQWRVEHGVEMSRRVRRRLRKQAKDLLRPGRPVADLHAALVQAQRQREVWMAHCPSGSWPRLPEGLAAIEEEHRAVSADLALVAGALATTPAGGRLEQLPFAELTTRLERLRADADGLRTVAAGTGLVRSLTAVGLAPLVDDLADRRVGPAMVAAELELAWWSSVFELVLAADPTLAAQDGTSLGRLTADYARLDREHVAGLGGPVRAAAAAHVTAALRGRPDQAESLFAELVEDRVTSLRDTIVRHPDVAARLRPVLAAAPLLVPQVLPPTRTVDLVVIDAAGHLGLETVLPALARGRQVVVVGDPRCASGSALPALAGVLPTVTLSADGAPRDPYLTAFLAEHGYAGVLEPVPLPGREPLVRLDVVAGSGMPDPATGTVDSTRAEVERVVDLVLDHARRHPEESLAVVTVSPQHAEQVREAVLTRAREDGALTLVDRARPEPFLVTDLTAVAGLRRDALVLSVGYGRTPHGRVLHAFGPLAAPDGGVLLLETLGATRHRLSVVSCFGAHDLDPARLRSPGARLLADLLAFAGDPTGTAVVRAAEEPADGPSADAVPGPVIEGRTPVIEGRTPVIERSGPVPAGSDRLVLDLAERLWRLGFVVGVDHGVAAGRHLPLVVGHPDRPDEFLVAVLTDDPAYVSEPSVRVRDRLVGERLERLGWSVVRVWSAAAFLDPDAEVARVARAVQARLAGLTGGGRPAGTARARDARSADPPASSGQPGPTPGSGGASADLPAAVAADGAAVAADGSATAAQASTGTRPGARPDVRPGLPIAAYGDDQLEDLVAWLVSDGRDRTAEERVDELRVELGLTRRSSRVDAALAGAVRRVLAR